ncbi:cupin domain-containing protein [Paenibacillus cremeus]|uniref:Cupin domain-containing protein n=1 Tax=Paenibacillus cremeus TaxID=2163881 RepID=A0A559JBR8_9BACL|nr:cupin domain-containing protein [Paenibacillus cremeus]TVX97297.1 cupin domain-containing protein [Paenibacillus cremeus]
MYYDEYLSRYPYYVSLPVYNYVRMPLYWVIPQDLNHPSQYDHRQSSNMNGKIELKDHGKTPFVININEAAKQNNTFRTAVWTGNHLQVVVMSINVGEDIGLEVHPYVDQFLRIEEGQGLVRMGDTKGNLNFEQRVYEDYAIMVPAGKWHNVINTGNTPLKLYTIYAPPQHPFGTVQQTKAVAMAAGD